MYSLLTILPPSFSIYIYQYSCLRLLKMIFFSNTSLQYKLYDSFSILSKVVSARIGMQLAYSSGSCADLINNAYLLFTFCSSPILVNDRMVNQFILKLMTTFHRCVHHLRGICYSLQVYHTNRLRIPENYCKFNT